MKKRSLFALFLLTVVTLGLYELVWVAQTRNEMVSKFGAKIPSAGYVILVRFLQLAGLIAVVVIVLHAAPSSNRNDQQILDSRSKPAAICYGQYNQSSECRSQIDAYVAPLPFDALDWAGVALGIIFASVLLDLLFMLRWVAAYGLAVQKVTKQTVPGLVAVLALGGVVPILGMLHVQNVFNKTSAKIKP